ncbi:hypothetical protein AB0I45_01345 [Brevibacterium sp. NPDC049920]|uniref:hypothetical protein n=1 Tax=Brevibacterium sp. NPDC049920 TaxID=3155279 RepID=UPI0033D70998
MTFPPPNPQPGPGDRIPLPGSGPGRPGRGPSGPGRPKVTMSGRSFDFDAENGRGGPGGGHRPWTPGENESAKRGGKGCGCIIGLLVVLVLLLSLIGSCSSSATSGSAQCGDYDLVNGEYVSAPNRGDYDKQGENYTYVGCDSSTRSGGGGFWFFPFIFGGGSSGSDSNYGGGPGYRGGGSGTGK